MEKTEMTEIYLITLFINIGKTFLKKGVSDSMLPFDTT